MNGMHRVYLDTQIYIYVLEKNPIFWDKAKDIIKEVEKRGDLVIASTLILAELLSKPYEIGDLQSVEKTKLAFLNTTNLVVRDTDLEIAETAGYLRGKYGLRTPDAIHLATAIELGCDRFITNDKHFSRATNKKIDIEFLE